MTVPSALFRVATGAGSWADARLQVPRSSRTVSVFSFDRMMIFPLLVQGARKADRTVLNGSKSRNFKQRGQE
jgi:hypothetical protein